MLAESGRDKVSAVILRRTWLQYLARGVITMAILLFWDTLHMLYFILWLLLFVLSIFVNVEHCFLLPSSVFLWVELVLLLVVPRINFPSGSDAFLLRDLAHHCRLELHSSLLTHFRSNSDAVIR